MVVSSDPDPIFFPHKSEIFINADPDLGSGDSIDAVPTGSRHLTLEDKELENIFLHKKQSSWREICLCQASKFLLDWLYNKEKKPFEARSLTEQTMTYKEISFFFGSTLCLKIFQHSQTRENVSNKVSNKNVRTSKKWKSRIYGLNKREGNVERKWAKNRVK